MDDMLMDDIADEKEICKDAIMAVSEALINMSDKINIMTGDIKNLQEMYEKLRTKIAKIENKNNAVKTSFAV